MRAIVARAFGGPEVLEGADVAPPTPLPTEILVRVDYAGLNPVDCQTRSGNGGMAAVVGKPPWIPGWDLSGIVEAVGRGVTRFAAGDLVFGMPQFPRPAGAYAEYVAAPALHFAGLPDHLSMAEAAALPLGSLTVWQSLVDGAGLRKGAHLLIHGASGGVGHLAVQIAAAEGAHVIATARRRNHDMLRRLGAEELVDREVVPVGEAASGVELVLDLVGGAETGRALDALGAGGTLVAVSGGANPAVKEEAARRGIRVLEPLVEPDGRALDWIGEIEGLRPEIQDILPLAQASRAHELLEAGGVRGKLVLEVG